MRRHSRTNWGRYRGAASVDDAIAGADPVVFALWVGTIKVAALLPASAHYVKAFGTLGADALAGSANRDRGGPCASTPPTTTSPRRRSSG